jgi:glycine/sarcosine N-methyltransferase
MVTVPLYDELFDDYDRFVNWERRLAYELPFIERLLVASDARRVLDVACGTGRHAISLAERGYEVVGADLSARMIARARENADRLALDRAPAKGQVSFVVAGFGELAERVGGQFDALLCLGNSLPHVLTAAALRATLTDLAGVLRPGGLLLVQERNFDAVMANRARWMAPQSHREEGHEWLFLRFYDFNPDGTLTFNMVMLQRGDGEAWVQRVQQTTLYPWSYGELTAAVEAAGFDHVACYGDMDGAPYAQDSGNLVVVADRRPE